MYVHTDWLIVHTLGLADDTVQLQPILTMIGRHCSVHLSHCPHPGLVQEQSQLVCFTRNGSHHLCSPTLSLQRWGDGGGGRHTDISRERGGVVYQSREEGSRRGVDLLNQFLQLGVVYHTHKHITQDGEEDPSLLESRSTDDVINRQGICNYILTYVYNVHQYLHMYIGPSQTHQSTCYCSCSCIREFQETT